MPSAKEADTESLESLVEHPGWGVLERSLFKQLQEAWNELAARGQSERESDYLRGRMETLQGVIALPKVLMQERNPKIQ